MEPGRMKAVWGALLLLLAACGQDGPVEPAAPEPVMAIAAAPESGDNQVGLAGRDLAQPLRVQVTRDGVPAAGVEVVWTAQRGTIASAGVTDADGVAAAIWTLPRLRRDLAAYAALGDATVPKVSFSAEVQFPSLEILSGGGQEAVVLQSLPEPVQVRVTWQGRPLPDETVLWSAGITPTAAATDATGAASGVWRMSTTAGAASAVAALEGEGAPSVTFDARTLPGPAAMLTWTHEVGFWSSGAAPTVSARVTDAYGNGVAGSAVSWSLVAGEGVVAPDGTSDAGGFLSAGIDVPAGSREDLVIEAAGDGIAPATATLRHADFVFSSGAWYDQLAPDEVTVPAGSVVRWVSWGYDHPMAPRDGSAGGGMVKGGGPPLEYRFDTPGTYQWACTDEPWEITTVIVTP